MLGGGVLGVIGTASPVNASPIAHPFAVPVAVPNAAAAGKLAKLLGATRNARTAQLGLDAFSRSNSPYNGSEELTWQGTGVAGFTPDRAAVSYQGLFYKILASSQAVIVNSKLYVHRVGLSIDPAGFGVGSSLGASSSGTQWLEGPLPDGPLGVVTANFVSLLGDLPLMLAHRATVGIGSGGFGYVVTVPKTALIALYEAHGLSAYLAKADVDGLGHFVCEIDVLPGAAAARNKVGEIGFYFQSSSFGQRNELSMFAGYGAYGISVSVVAPPKDEVRWAPRAADENLTI